MATSTVSASSHHADNNGHRQYLDRLFNEGRVEDGIARSLENANKEENWSFLKELVDRVISADLSEKVDSELKTNDKNLSLQKLTENLIVKFLSLEPEINESNPQEYEDISELAAAAARNEHFREIWSKIQFVKPDVEDQRVNQSNIKDIKLKEKLEVLAKDKLRSDPFFMSLEWFQDFRHFQY